MSIQNPLFISIVPTNWCFILVLTPYIYSTIYLNLKLLFYTDPKCAGTELVWHSSISFLKDFIFKDQKSERLLFNANSAIFQLYHGENKLTRWGWGPLCIRPTCLVGFYSASSLKQHSWWACHPNRTHYPESEPTSLCSFS